VSMRARVIIHEIERPEREREHDALMRVRQLALLTVDFKDAKLSEVLASIEKQTGYGFRSSFKGDPGVTVAAKDAPVQKVLDAIEDQIEGSIRLGKVGVYEVSPGKFLRKPRLYLPGATLEFNARPAKASGKVVGRVVKVTSHGASDPTFGPWEVFGADGKPRVVNSCENCGPRMFLVRGDPEAELRIRTRSRFVWRSPYELEVAKPEIPQSFRVGAYTIAYEFPKVSITAAEPVPTRLFAHAELRGRLKEGKGVGISLEWVGGFGVGAAKKDPEVWCDCPEGPLPAAAKTDPVMRSSDHSKYERNASHDFESMKVLFYKPLEEAFEGEVVIPAD